MVTVTGVTGVYVLQMSYDPAAAAANSEGEGSLQLGWLHNGLWVPAAFGNSNPVLGTHYFSAWNGTMTLGDYGVDTTNFVVWAVLDHNSEFAVIPEPLALPGGLMLMTIVGIISRRRKA